MQHAQIVRGALLGSTALVAITIAHPAHAQSARGGAGGVVYSQPSTSPTPTGGTSGVAGGDANYTDPAGFGSDGGAGGGANARGGNLADNGGAVTVNTGGAGGAAGAAGQNFNTVNTAGGYQISNASGGGGGGNGAVTAAGTLASAIAGGSGGAGAAGGGSAGGGGGGAGGGGIDVAGPATFTVNTTVSGGAGGVGGLSRYGGGGGGGGGYGVTTTGAFAITVASGGIVRGGAGGAGGNNTDGYNIGGIGGAGGVGIYGSGTLNNAGTIVGGVRGAAGRASTPGAGGAGVVGASLAITNTGAIAGGSGADAITFTGGANSLALGNGGTTGTLTGGIGIAGSLSIDPGVAAGASVTIANVIHDAGGAGSLTKIGAGTLVLTGANTFSGRTTVTAGTLSLGGTGSARDVYVNGGELTLTSAMAVTGTIHAIDPTINYNTAATYTAPVSLEVPAGSQAGDPTILNNRSGGAVTLSGAIAEGTGFSNQYVTFRGAAGSTTTLTSTGNRWTGVTTIDAGATLIGASDTVSGGSIVVNGTLRYTGTGSGNVTQAISGTGALQVSGLTANTVLSFRGQLSNTGGLTVRDGSSVAIANTADGGILENGTGDRSLVISGGAATNTTASNGGSGLYVDTAAGSTTTVDVAQGSALGTTATAGNRDGVTALSTTVLTNAGTISSGFNAGVALAGGGSIDNAGTITGGTGDNGYGIAVTNGAPATVTLQATSVVSGTQGGVLLASSGGNSVQFSNAGAVTGAFGISATAAGTPVIANLAGGQIVGGSDGIRSAGAIDITNAGLIGSGTLTNGTYAAGGTSGNSSGITLTNESGGIIRNQADATIQGRFSGIYAQGTAALRVENAGLIVGTGTGNGIFGSARGAAGATVVNTGQIRVDNVTAGNDAWGVALYNDDNMVVNTGSIAGDTAVELQGGGISTVVNGATGTLAGLTNSIRVSGTGGLAFTNFGTATGALSSTSTGDVTIVLQAGSRTDAITTGAGADSLTLYNGEVSGAVIDPTTGLTLRDTGTFAPATTGAIDLGTGNNALILRGIGDGDQNGAAGTLTLGTVPNVASLTKLDSGSWTLTGTPAGTTALAAIYAGGAPGTTTPVPGSGGSLIFDGTTGLTSAIYVNGGTIVEAQSGAFGTGLIHAVDPTIVLANGTNANDYSLEVAANASDDPTTFQTANGNTVTLTGSITTGIGNNINGQPIDLTQPVTFALTPTDAQAPAATFVLTSAANSWPGTTTIDGGVTLRGTTATISGGSIVDNGTLVYAQDTAGMVAKQIYGGGMLVKDGLATVTLTQDAEGRASNGYSGGTTVLAGRLIEDNQQVATGMASVAAGATLEIRTDRVAEDGTPVGLLQYYTTFTGAGTVQKTGAGNLAILSAFGQDQGGLFDVQAGSVNGSSSFAADYSNNLGSLNIAAGAVFDGVEGSIAFDKLTGTGTLRGGYFGYGSTTIGVANGSSTFDGTITDNTDGDGNSTGILYLTKAGTGTQTLTGTNTYSGTTTINAGTLALTGTGSIANSYVYVKTLYDDNEQPIGVGTLDIAGLTDGGMTVQGINGRGNITLGANTLTLAPGNGSGFYGVASGTGGITLGTGSALYLSGANTYTGTTLVSTNAYLELDGDNVLANTSTLTVADGGQVNLRGSNNAVAALDLAGTLGGYSYTDEDGVPFTTVLSAVTSTLRAGSVVDGAELTGGTVNVLGDTLLTGRITSSAIDIAAGTLTLGDPEAAGDPGNAASFPNRLSASSALSIASGATLLMGGAETVASLSDLNGGGGTVDLAGSLLTVGGDNRDTTFSGVIGNTGPRTRQYHYVGSFSVGDGPDAATNPQVYSGEGAAALIFGGNADDYSISTNGVDPTQVNHLAFLDGRYRDYYTGEETPDDSYLQFPASQNTAYLGSYSEESPTGLGYSSADYAYSAYVYDNTELGEYINYVFDVQAAADTNGLTKTGAGTLTLTGASTYTGLTTVVGGTLAVNGSIVSATNVLSGATLTGGGSVGATTIADGGTLTGTQGATLTLASLGLSSGSLINATFGNTAGNALFAVTGDLTLDGTVNVSGTGAFGPGVYGLATYGDMLTDNGLVIGTTPPGAQRLDVQTSVAGRVNILAASNDLQFWDGGDAARYDNGAVDGGSGTWTATSPTFTDATGRFNGPIAPQPGFPIFTANAGTVTVDNSAGAIAVTGIQFAADGYVLTGGPIALAAANTVIRVGDGTAASAVDTATIAAALTGANGLEKTDVGTLVLSGVNTYTGLTTVTAGTLALAGGQAIVDANAVLVSGGGTLALRAGETIGSLGGRGAITLDANTLTVGTGNQNSDFAGVISGSGGLTQTGSGTLTLSGANSYMGTTLVSGGTLAFGAADVLADSSTLTVASGAVADLGTYSDTVGSLGLNGTLNGSGTLTAAGYALNDATVNANLGAGALSNTGGLSTLNGTAAASTVAVDAGTLTLGAADRLADAAAVTVANGAVLDLAAFSDTVGTLGLNGTLAGTGTLTAAGYALNGATVNANLGAGALSNTGGVSTLRGTAAATTVAVDAGTLTLGAADRLADAAAVTVANGAVLDLAAFSDTVGSLGLNGAINGTGTLTAASYVLNGAAVNANLGAGALSNTGGVSTLRGTAAATTVSVDAGTLTLGAADRLADTAAVTVASGAVLDLAAFSDTVGSLGLNGTLAGTGTLTAASYALNGAAVNANLGAGALTQVGGISVVAGTVAGTTVAVTGGTLRLAANERLNDAAAVTLGTGTTLDVNGRTETVASVNGAGTVALGAGRLVLAGAGASSLGALTGTGNLDKTGTGTLALAGTYAATGTIGLTAGTTSLTGTTAGGIRVAGGTLTGTGMVAGTLTLTSGTLSPGLGGTQPFGTLTVGALNASGGAYAVDFGGAALGFRADLVRVTGAAALSGTVAVNPTAFVGNETFQQTYTVLQAGSLTGTFANLATFTRATSDPSLFYRLRYDLVANAVVLQVQRQVDFAAAVPNGTANEQAVARALNGTAGMASDAYAATLNAIAGSSVGTRAGTYDSLSGEAIADVTSTAIFASDRFNDLLRSRAGLGNGNAEDAGTYAMRSGMAGGTRHANGFAGQLQDSVNGQGGTAGADNGAGVWLQGFGAGRKLEGKPGQATTRSFVDGLAGGIDGRIGGFTVGIGGGFTSLDTRVRSLASKVDGTLYQGGGYVAYDTGTLYGSVTGNYYEGDVNVRRQLSIGGVGIGQATGRTRVNGFTAAGVLGARFDIGGGNRAGVELTGAETRATRRGYTEQGIGGLNLVAARDRRDVFTGTAQVKVSHLFTGNGWTAEPYASGGVQYNSGDLATVNALQFGGAPTGTGGFLVQGASLEQTQGVFTGGVEIRPSAKVRLDVSAGGAVGNRTHEGQVKVSARIGF